MIISHSVEETIAAGSSLAQELVAGSVITLSGDLGAGKTHFVKGLAQGLGYRGEVTSPTFSLVHEYRGGSFVCFHFDFYRLQEISELEGIGFFDYLEEPNGVCVVEWAEKFPEALPKNVRTIKIELLGEQTRGIKIQ